MSFPSRCKSEIIAVITTVMELISCTNSDVTLEVGQDVSCLAVVITMISDLHQGANLMLQPVKVLRATLFLRSEVKY